MAILKQAHAELFKRGPDEMFDSLPALARFVHEQRGQARDRWVLPHLIKPKPDRSLAVQVGTDGAFLMNDWSFTQLCQLAGVSRDTVNKLSAQTASLVFQETLPQEGKKPLQVFTQNDTVRSLHLASYTRLHNSDVVTMLQEFAVDFQPPQKAVT